MTRIYIKPVDYEERAVWGTCPVCGATSGQPCSPLMGITLVREFGDQGTHTARLFNAPINLAIAAEEEKENKAYGPTPNSET